MSLQGKVTIITGAGQGIGQSIALVFAQAGAKVMVSDLDMDKAEKVAAEIKQQGGDALAIACDVADQAALENLFNQTIKEFGALDILVNNAGVFPFKPFLEISAEDWDKVLDINLKGTFFASQLAAREMQVGGRIINISSIAAQVAFSGLSHYCASKGGVESLTRVLALELAEKKITVNAVAPGATDTPGASQGLDKTAKKQTEAAIPLARMGKPEEIAAAVLFLASKEAAYITGQVLTVDGGWTLG